MPSAWRRDRAGAACRRTALMPVSAEPGGKEQDVLGLSGFQCVVLLRTTPMPLHALQPTAGCFPDPSQPPHLRA